jgi:hypothetical protein
MNNETSSDLGMVHEVSIEALDAPDEIKEFFTSVNDCAHRLQDMKRSEIDPRTDPIMPKVVWKMHSVCQSAIYRAVELQNAVAILVNADNLLGGIIMARTLIELMAFISDLQEKISRGVDSNSLPMIDEAIMATSFSTRWEEMPEGTKATNILTIIERFDRDFMGEKKARPVSGVHAVLSEYVHPNWAGMAGFFGFVNYESRVDRLSVRHKDKEKLYLHIAAGCTALAIIEHILRQLLANEPKVWAISEAARLSG